MVAIDNPVLQVQIRTRPRSWYSTITQVAIIIKTTGEVFRVRLDGQVENTIGDSGAGPAKYSVSAGSHARHTNNLKGPTQASYIRVEQESYGIWMTAYGCDYFFAGSEGMCGSWDSNDVRFRDGTTMDMSGDYDDRKSKATAFASDWQIPSDQNLLWNPSNICDPSSACESYELFACEDWRRKLQVVNPGCSKSCSDIGIQQFIEQCEKDVEITGDSSWACTGAYEDPVIVLEGTLWPSSQPSSVPSSIPSSQPSTQPSSRPSSVPSSILSSQPSTQPSTQPSVVSAVLPSECSAHGDCPGNKTKCKGDNGQAKKCRKMQTDCKVWGSKKKKRWGCVGGAKCVPLENKSKWGRCPK